MTGTQAHSPIWLLDLGTDVVFASPVCICVYIHFYLFVFLLILSIQKLNICKKKRLFALALRFFSPQRRRCDVHMFFQNQIFFYISISQTLLTGKLHPNYWRRQYVGVCGRVREGVYHETGPPCVPEFQSAPPGRLSSTDSYPARWRSSPP